MVFFAITFVIVLSGHKGILFRTPLYPAKFPALTSIIMQEIYGESGATEHIFTLKRNRSLFFL